MEKLDLLLPEPPTRDGRFHATAFGDNQEPYLVDLYEYTCTCPDFAHRASAPARSITRACKHIAGGVLNRSEMVEQLDDIELAVLHARGRKSVYFRTETANGGEVVVGVDGESGWADVFFRKYRKGDPLGGPTGAWDCYGLDRYEWRWSYGEGPRGAREIKELLAPLRFGEEPAPSQRSESRSGCVLVAAAFLLSPIAFWLTFLD